MARVPRSLRSPLILTLSSDSAVGPVTSNTTPANASHETDTVEAAELGAVKTPVPLVVTSSLGAAPGAWGGALDRQRAAGGLVEPEQRPIDGVEGDGARRDDGCVKGDRVGRGGQRFGGGQGTSEGQSWEADDAVCVRRALGRGGGRVEEGLVP
jgi:hypothetical protein